MNKAKEGWLECCGRAHDQAVSWEEHIYQAILILRVSVRSVACAGSQHPGGHLRKHKRPYVVNMLATEETDTHDCNGTLRFHGQLYSLYRV